MGRHKDATRQYDVLDAIREHKRQFGMSPTHRELMLYTGITSTSVISYYVNRLKEEGLVDFIPGSPRSLELTESGVMFDRSGYPKMMRDLVAFTSGGGSARPHLIYRAWKMDRNYTFYYRIRQNHLKGQVAR